jgi:Fe-S-cluster containining protein
MYWTSKDCAVSVIKPIPPTSGNANISCATCAASCCRLEVMLMGEDDIPRHLCTEDQWGGSVMRRLRDGWCAALDRQSMRCTIYQRRPEICRDYEMGTSDCLIEYMAR